MSQVKLNFVSFFSGGGGFDLGLKEAGFEPILCSDIEDFARATHHINFPKVPFLHKDIRKITREDLIEHIQDKQVTLVCGGPPCQGFTTMGDKLAADPRNNVLHSFLRVINILSPQAVLIENVPGLKTRYAGMYYRELVAGLTAQGYEVSSKVISFDELGAPQKRKRIIIVGLKRQCFDFEIVNAISSAGTLKPSSTVAEALEGLPAADSGKISNHISLRHSEVVVERYKLIDQGGKLPPPEDLPAKLRRGNFGNTYQRLHPHRPASTMVPGNNAFPIHPFEHRSLTPREAARIQTFPDSYVFAGTRAQQCIQVGNAVPPIVAFALGKAITAQLKAIDRHNFNTAKLEKSFEQGAAKEVHVHMSTKTSSGPSHLTVVDLFSGIGGFSAGFKQAGYSVILKSDNNPWVAKVSSSNFPDVPFFQLDLSAPTAKSQIKSHLKNVQPTVLVGGPPCQGFSLFGKRRLVRESEHHYDARNDLVHTFAEYAGMLKPDWVIMENVPGIESLNGGSYVKSIYGKLRRYGFKRIEHRILNAADYGVPQTRKRFILIATRTNLIFPWPKPKFFESPKGWQKYYRSVSEVLTDLEDMSGPSVSNHTAPNHHPIVIERFSFIQQGKKLDPQSLPPYLKKGLKTNQDVKHFSKVMYRLHPDKPAPTLVPGHNAFPVHPNLNRTLTIREAARLQTLPDSFVFAGPIIQQGLQVGNAFPTLLAQVIAERLSRIIRNNWTDTTVTPLAKYSMVWS